MIQKEKKKRTVRITTKKNINIIKNKSEKINR